MLISRVLWDADSLYSSGQLPFLCSDWLNFNIYMGSDFIAWLSSLGYGADLAMKL